VSVWAASTGHDDARDRPGLFAGAGAFYASSRWNASSRSPRHRTSLCRNRSR
jgi:hypothetical protein